MLLALPEMEKQRCPKTGLAFQNPVGGDYGGPQAAVHCCVEEEDSPDGLDPARQAIHSRSVASVLN